MATVEWPCAAPVNTVQRIMMTESAEYVVEEPVDEFVDTKTSIEPMTARSVSTLLLRVCVEFVGTFLVCFFIYAAYTYGAVMYQSSLTFILLVTALAYTSVTALFSRIALVHLNPAVTIGSMLTTRLIPKEMRALILAEMTTIMLGKWIFRSRSPRLTIDISPTEVASAKKFHNPIPSSRTSG